MPTKIGATSGDPETAYEKGDKLYQKNPKLYYRHS